MGWDEDGDAVTVDRQMLHPTSVGTVACRRDRDNEIEIEIPCSGGICACREGEQNDRYNPR